MSPTLQGRRQSQRFQEKPGASGAGLVSRLGGAVQPFWKENKDRKDGWPKRMASRGRKMWFAFPFPSQFLSCRDRTRFHDPCLPRLMPRLLRRALVLPSPSPFSLPFPIGGCRLEVVSSEMSRDEDTGESLSSDVVCHRKRLSRRLVNWGENSSSLCFVLRRRDLSTAQQPSSEVVALFRRESGPVSVPSRQAAFAAAAFAF